MHRCKYPLVVAAAPTVPDEAVSKLTNEPNVEVRRVEWVEVPQSWKEQGDKVYANPQFVRNFTKLRLFEWHDLNKCVYIDADAFPMTNVDDMFLAPAFSATLDNMSADEAFDEANFAVPSTTNDTPMKVGPD